MRFTDDVKKPGLKIAASLSLLLRGKLDSKCLTALKAYPEIDKEVLCPSSKLTEDPPWHLLHIAARALRKSYRVRLAVVFVGLH